MIVNTKEMLLKAKKDKYAVPQFNINNLEWTKFILEECQANNSPVILGVSEGAIKYMGGYKTVVDMINGLYNDLKITIPVSIHLDHGSSFESCVNAIDNGFTSVMIDASNFDLEENIKITKDVVAYARTRNVTVEAEIGHVGGSEDGVVNEICYAEVDHAVRLVEKTDIDSLAPALGSVHGLYKGEPKLHFVRMSEIREKVKTPLVLHGGTGIPDNLIKQAIDCGIAKVNVNTELQIAWSNATREYIVKNEKVYDPRKIIKAGENAMKKAIKDKIILFGSDDKA